MPDSPDYSKFLSGSVRFSLQDFGELASRLGSINVYDRRGETLFMDDCSHGLVHWTPLGGGVGYNTQLSVDIAHLSPYSFKMTGGSSGAHMSELEKYFALFEVGKVGFEAAIHFVEEVNYFQIIFDCANGSHIYRGWIKWDVPARKVYYLSSTGVEIELMDVNDVITSNSGFSFFKPVVDFVNMQYSRFLLSSSHVDMSGLALQQLSASTFEYYRVSIRLISNTGVNGIGYLGGFILTGNEP